MRKIQLRLAWRAHKGYQEWLKEPEYKDVEALQLSQYWAAHREYEGDSWTLTHIPTGFAAARGFWNITEAQKVAAALTAKYGREAFNFTDPEQASQFSEAKSIIHSFGGW